MKKLSLLLLTLCLSLATWAGVDDWTHLNPFAYDLKSEVIENGTQLKLTYSLNATAVTSDTYNEDHHGLQIYLIDENGNRIKKEDGTTWACTSGSYQKGKDHSVIIPIADLPPAAKETNLSWEVVVHGNKNWTKPKAITSYLASQTATYKPRAGHGIAIEKDPNSKWFGRIYVAEACTNTSGKNSVLEYDMLFNYKTYHHKDKLDGGSSYFSSSVNYEPHRLKISKDGRMFATCYHPHAISAVLEYIGNGEWRTVVKADEGKNDDADGSQSLYPINDIYDCRPIAMDVKGSEDDLKIIVAWIKPKGRKAQNQWDSKIEIYEYNVGSNEATIQSNKGLDQDAGTLVGTYIESNTATNVTTLPNTCGLLFQAFFHTNDATPWVTEEHGLIDILYGEGADNPIWMKIDFACGSSDLRRRGQILYFNDSKKTFDYLTEKTTKYIYHMPNTVGTYCNYDGSYGGNAFYIKGDTLLTASGANTLLVYTGVKSQSLQYQTSISTGASPGIGAWTTGFAEDYAGNLYALSEEADNIVAFAMPYDGTRITRASAEQSFTVSDPIPNILATDLRYDIVRGKNQYEFSFNVNTKPQEAQIRFYESYEDMQKSLNVVNADDFDGTNANKPVYVYNIPQNKLIQGRIAVTLGAVGGQADANGVINNNRLPAGVLYWSVYVKAPRKSSVFAPIYRLEGQTHATEGYERKHATVNNYPETDGFGNIIVAHNPQNTTNDATRPEKGLRIYGISDSGNDEHAYTNTDRYSLRATYLNKNSTTGMLNYPRRMDVAPDGKVYIADEGSPTNDKDWKNVSNGAVTHVRGGVKVWDPAAPNKFTQFSDNRILTATSVALWDGKLYATNTYDEYVKHLNGKTNYTKEQQANTSQYGWNGFVGYVLNKYKSPGDWDSWSGNKTDYALGRGDASGNIAIVAMDKGVWMCQHKEHNRAVKDATYQPLADNLDGFILSFVPYGSNARKWQSCAENGVENFDSPTERKERADASDFSQKLNSPVQSTPGGGIAYKKVNGKEYLYVVNHDGNIAQLEITSWSGSGTEATPTIPIANIKILTTPAATKSTKEASAGGYSTTWTGAYITSMTFDYAGNLVTTTGKNYHDGPQDIVIYTMPYDRVNAREIQAPNSCRMIPERIAHLDMDKEDLDDLIEEHQKDHPTGCAIDLYRPIQGGMFNTICLPFTLELTELPEGHPLKNATLKQYTGLNLNTVGGEKVLELVFTDVNGRTIIANKPYIIQPEENYNSIIRFAGPLQLTNTTGEDVNHKENSNNYNMTFQGIIPYQEITPTIQDGISLTLMLVADNRLAEMTTTGYMYGFRGYFKLNQPLPKGMRTRITTQKPVATNTTIVVDGKRVNVEKFIREGRVCVRVGDTLYNINGEVIGR